jgi:type IV secretion system protein VirD4
MPKGRFVVTKTGAYPMRTRLKLFKDWGITFGKPYEVEEKSARKVEYADRFELEEELIRRNAAYTVDPDIAEGEPSAHGGIEHAPAQEIRNFPRRKDPVRIE